MSDIKIVPLGIIHSIFSSLRSKERVARSSTSLIIVIYTGRRAQ